MAKIKVNIPKTTSFLVLDDMESFRTAGVNQLNILGFSGNYHEAADIAEAKKQLKDNKIDFILSDWNLPDGTGFSLLEEVRTWPAYKDTPFLMITTEAGIGNILEAINAGASNYLIKPWNPKSFLEALAVAWDKHHKASPAKKKIQKSIAKK